MSIVDAIRRVLERHPEVRVAYVFGSMARGEGRARSDIDVALLFGSEPLPGTVEGLAEELEAAVGRVVDLIVLAAAPPLLAHEVVTAGQRVLCRDERERVRFETRAAARYLDTARLRAVQQAYLHERAEARRER
ncbi:MAG: type VII toxin-antitoxin system MntA family adenylyltransferase antitoxin [Candidatus Rokuibacteriota bacterium]